MNKTASGQREALHNKPFPHWLGSLRAVWANVFLALFFFLLYVKIFWLSNLISTKSAHGFQNAWAEFFHFSWKSVPHFSFSACIFVITLVTGRRALFIAWYILHSLYLFVHLAFFLNSDNFFHILQCAANFREGSSLLTHSAIPLFKEYWVLLIDGLPFIGILFFYPLIVFPFTKHRLMKLAFVIILFTASGLSFIGNFRQEKWADSIGARYKGEDEIINHYGFFLSDVIDLLRGVDEKELIKNFRYGKTVSFSGRKDIKNIICIQVEAMDYNIVHAAFNGRYVMPFLQSLTTTSIYYPFVYNYNGAGCTSDVEFSIINSVIPLNRYPSIKLRSYTHPNSFVKWLRSSGFATSAFHNNTGNFFNRNQAFYVMGFSKFYDIKEMGLQEIGWGAQDADMFDYVLSRLAYEEGHFFYYIITISSHEPFKKVRLYYNNEHYANIKDRLTRDYFNAFSYVDRELERLVGFIMAHYPDTYIFIWGDHGSYVKSSLFSSVYDTVGLFIITPERKRYFECTQAVSVLDIAPTILDASSVHYRIKTYGKSLLQVPFQDEYLLEKTYEVVARTNKFQQKKKRAYIHSYLIYNDEPIRLPEFIVHGGGIIGGMSLTNALEAFEQSYNNGARFFEADIEWTGDNHMVLLHDWGRNFSWLYGMPPGVRPLSEFKKAVMRSNLTSLTLEGIVLWMRQHPDVFLITDIKHKNIEGMTYIAKNYKDIAMRIIPQIYEFREYEYARELGFAQVILTLYKENYSDEEVLSFVSRNQVLAITMPHLRATQTNLPCRLNLLGVFVYAHTINDSHIWKQAKTQWAANGCYTDKLHLKN